MKSSKKRKKMSEAAAEEASEERSPALPPATPGKLYSARSLLRSLSSTPLSLGESPIAPPPNARSLLRSLSSTPLSLGESPIAPPPNAPLTSSPNSPKTVTFPPISLSLIFFRSRNSFFWFEFLEFMEIFGFCACVCCRGSG